MRKELIGTALGALLLAGCGESGRSNETAAPASENEAAAPEVNATAAIENMPEETRNAVFIRAIQDAGQECQHVDASVKVGQEGDLSIWEARCQGAGSWRISVNPNGDAVVIPGAPAP